MRMAVGLLAAAAAAAAVRPAPAARAPAQAAAALWTARPHATFGRRDAAAIALASV